MSVALRHNPFAAAAIVTAIVATHAVNPALAQTVKNQAPTPQAPAPRAEPLPTLDAGDRLRAAGDLMGALRVYHAVRAKQASLNCDMRIAETEDKLGQYGFAYTEYANILERHDTLLKPQQKRAIESRLRKLNELTGVLLLEPLLPKANVLIDERTLPESPLLRPIRVTRGERRIFVEQPGYQTVTLTQTVGAGLVKVTLPLTPLPVMGTLNVSTLSTANAILYVDGSAVGPLPQKLQLQPGDHLIHADGPTVYAEVQKVTLLPSGSQEISLTLRNKLAVVSVDPVALDAFLYVNGKGLGTGPRNVDLPPGTHTFELRRPGYQTQKLVVETKSGEKSTLRAAPYVAEPTQPKPVVPAGLALTPTQPPAPAPAPTQKPPGASPKPDAADGGSPYKGFYGTLILPIMLGGASTHSYKDHCPGDAYDGACTTSAPRGGGLGLRLGYVYEWLGLEVFAAGAVDVSSAELKFPPVAGISKEMLDLAGQNVFVRAGGLLGGGLRFSTPLQGIRFTVGADYVYVARKVLSIPDSFTGSSLGYSVPGYFIDGGIQIGNTPGTRFYLGAFLFVESAHDLVLKRDLESLGVDASAIPPELTTATIYQGRQYFFGPLLGIAFGH